eukprot:CAMPEP_0113500826 /NCGR_PEP_ID=MMETSP0014_2-20120614/32571_1 /TAXON_ID=2857 /ORGANISM="Nitzschia sp." /LENGTH=407 /DNA_ID=CAMNT_0000395259 /DNA_START=42 /DNA_END=1265 /DNA_ORIENTATION=+ /assembly_acc=CAM_ASM_000159
MAKRRGEESRFFALSDDQQTLLPPALQVGTEEYRDRLTAWKDAVIRNQFFFDLILIHHDQPHSQQQQQQSTTTSAVTTAAPTTDNPSRPQAQGLQELASDDDISKLTSVLKILVRDWSSEGKVERQQAYGPIIDNIRTYLPNSATNSSNMSPAKRICVPGSGVGRLAFELYCLGHEVQGNDFSTYMLLASDFVLNNGGQIAPVERPVNISPYLLESRNCHSFNDRTRSIQIPDVDPAQMIDDCFSVAEDSEENLRRQSSPPPPPDFSVAAGDFVGIYSHPKEAGTWDCVASCFFLDACPNIIETLQVVLRMLKPGGLLVNFGPLHFHWNGPPFRPDDKSLEEYRQRYSNLDDRYLSSIDMSWNDVRQVLLKMGFEILKDDLGIECHYTADRKSMMRTTYQCVSFVAR